MGEYPAEKTTAVLVQQMGGSYGGRLVILLAQKQCMPLGRAAGLGGTCQFLLRQTRDRVLRTCMSHGGCSHRHLLGQYGHELQPFDSKHTYHTGRHALIRTHAAAPSALTSHDDLRAVHVYYKEVAKNSKNRVFKFKEFTGFLH